MNNKHVIIGRFLCLLTFTNVKCGKTGLDCAETKYVFKLPVKAYSNRDSISITDTILLEVNEPTSLNDALTNQIVN